MKSRYIPFTILTFLSLLTALITGISVYYLIFSAFVIVAFFSALSLLIGYLQINYVQEISPEIGVKGEIVYLDMRIVNKFSMPVALVELEYDLPDESLNLYINKKTFGVLNEGTVYFRHEVLCKYRGKWSVGIRKAVMYDIFGLAKITIDFFKNKKYPRVNLIVRPRIVALDSIPLPYKENNSSKDQISRSTDDLAEVSDLRKYVQGDILKRVHWKVSYSKQELLVKNYTMALDPDTFIYVDCSYHGLSGLNAIKHEDMIVECATAVVHHLLSNNMPTKLITVEERGLELTGKMMSDFPAMYEHLSELTFSANFVLQDLFGNELPSTSKLDSIFIITHSMTISTFDNLIYLKEASINITILFVWHGIGEQDKKIEAMLEELIAADIKVIKIAPDDDLNKKLKE